MRVVRLTYLIIGFMTVGACGKALTESSAAGIIQKYIDGQGGGTVSISVGVLTNQIGNESPVSPEQLPAGMQRLLKAGFLQVKSNPVTYTNYSGSFVGRHYENLGFGAEAWTDRLDLQTTNENPPHVRGRFQSCDPVIADHCAAGTVDALVHRQEPTTLTLTVSEPRVMGLWTWEPGRPRRVLVALKRGNPDVLSGTFFLGHDIADPVNYKRSSVTFQAQGRATGSDIQQSVYTYSWTDTVPKDVINISTLRLGNLIVDSCEHLLLSNETSATATCNTHVKLTKEAEVIFGTRSTEQQMQASFGKQPDGKWTGTAISYSPPQYSIGQ